MADKVFGPHTNSQEVYEVAAKPVVKAAMEGVNGIEFFPQKTPKGSIYDLVSLEKVKFQYRLYGKFKSNAVN